MHRYIDALFDEGDHVCFADNPFEIKTGPLYDAETSHCYVTLNPHVKGSTRADKNISKLRNFLVEFDGMELDRQLEYVAECGMPYTTCVFSGNKSFHFVTSLVEPVETKAEYDQLVRWLYAAVPEADPSCKNPSRFTRLGEGTHKNKEPQTIEDVGRRVSKKEFLAWLASRCDEPRDTTKMAKQMGSEDYFRIQSSGYRSKLHKATIEFCKTGGRRGFRHKNIFIAACNFRDCYYPIEEAKFLLLKKITEIYTAQGIEGEIELKERAIEDAYQQAPRVQTRS